MKKNLLPFFLLAAVTASSQTLTHHFDPYQPEVVVGGLLSCSDNGSPFDSSYYTTFNLSNTDYGIEGDEYHITQVEFGIEQISGVASYPIRVRLYSTGQDFPEGFATLNGYTLEAESLQQVPAQKLEIYSVAISATIATDKVLVVEISYEEDPDGQAVVLLGGNPDGSWGSTWTVSPECGVDEPTTMATIAASAGIEGSFALVVNVLGQGSLGLEDHQAAPLGIYPNPGAGLVTVAGKDSVRSITVADTTGKIVASSAVPGNTIDISSLAAGIYYLTAESESGSATGKVVKY